MEKLNFTFKKSRKLGELISDYIALFKLIFKHFNKNILTIALPFMALFTVFVFFSINYFTELFDTRAERLFGVASGISIFLFLSFIVLIAIIMTCFFLLVSVFGIEYMLLLEEKGNTDFTFSDVWRNIKSNIGKYILFFLSSILVGFILAIPLSIVYMILVFIPLIGTIGVGILSAMLMLVMYTALFLYIQKRETLWQSYIASFKLVKSKLFEYGLAAYLFQFMVQIILGVLLIIPAIIFFIIGFTTIGFTEDFFHTFGGKFITAAGSSILTLFVIFSSIYLISFYVLTYFSLLEVSLSEETLDNIDQIGSTQDEF